VIVLLSVLAYASMPRLRHFRWQRPVPARRSSARVGWILFGDYGLHHVSVSDDVFYRLHYRDGVAAPVSSNPR
jgi:hypothetical protein